MQQNKLLGLVVVVLISFFILFSFLFTVNEGERAIILRLGKITQDSDNNPITHTPGLHFRIPLIDKKLTFSSKIQSYAVPSTRVYTLEQKTVNVDYYVKWKIKDFPLFYVRTNGSISEATSLIKRKVTDVLIAEFGTKQLRDVISDARIDVISTLRTKANASAQNLGIDVIDVRIMKIDYPSEVSKDVYERMRSARKRIATYFRSSGEAMKEEKMAKADAEVVVLLSEAKKLAAEVKAIGDAKSAKIFNDSYSKDKSFFAFYKKLETYDSSITNKDYLVINPADYDIYKQLFSYKEKQLTPTNTKQTDAKVK